MAYTVRLPIPSSETPPHQLHFVPNHPEARHTLYPISDHRSWHTTGGSDNTGPWHSVMNQSIEVAAPWCWLAFPTLHQPLEPHLCAGAWPGPSMGLQPELGDADGPPGHLDPSRSPAPQGSVRPVNASAARLLPAAVSSWDGVS